MEHVSVLIKPVSGKCNIRCEYCFYLDEMENRQTADFGVMSLDTAEEIIKKVFMSAQKSAVFAFLAENRFLVGLSMDGPAMVHDQFRKSPSGEGTQKTVVQTARLLDEYSVDYNILFTVTKEAAKKPEKLYEFFYKNNYK